MKKLLAIILIIISLFTQNVFAAEEEFLSVVDNASMLSEASKRYIYTQNKKLDKYTGARIIIATQENTGELSVNEYAAEYYDGLGIENIGRNNSVFIFICKSTDDYAVIVSDGISAALTKELAEQSLVDYMEPYFNKGDYSGACVSIYNAYAQWYADKYNISLDLTEDMREYDYIIKTEKQKKQRTTIFIVIAAIGAVFGLFSYLSRRREKKVEEKLRKKRQERRKRYMQIK